MNMSTQEGRTVWRRWFVICAMALVLSVVVRAQNDPGARGAEAGAGGPVAGLTVKEAKFFQAGADAFSETASVTGSVADTEPGLGPRFNSSSCVSCHSHPAMGGSSPATNPQVSVAPHEQVDPLVALGIISANGPVREVRFTTDGGVHDLFTIVGMPGAPAGCTSAMLSQPNFAAANAAGVMRFRIPTPTFGLGLIEAIPDATIEANAQKAKPFGMTGTVNRNGNDGTVTRFGWKAQNKSLMIFSGEAYVVQLFSDLLVHDVGTGDGIQQGLANGKQFRTAPLWGVGQRLFFLHDGRATNLLDAINEHAGEAARVISNFKGVSTGGDASSNLTATERQNLLYFLRSL